MTEEFSSKYPPKISPPATLSTVGNRLARLHALRTLLSWAADRQRIPTVSPSYLRRILYEVRQVLASGRRPAAGCDAGRRKRQCLLHEAVLLRLASLRKLLLPRLLLQAHDRLLRIQAPLRDVLSVASKLLLF